MRVHVFAIFVKFVVGLKTVQLMYQLFVFARTLLHVCIDPYRHVQ